MQGINFSQSQKQLQTQSQILSQRQIQILKMIGMNSFELRDEIYSAADLNPALEITEDSFLQGSKGVKRSSTDRRISTVHTGKASSGGSQEADTFQKILESAPDERESLQEHLLTQLNMSHLSDDERAFCRRLIENLDENGHHFLAPESLLDKDNSLHTASFLEKCISFVQKLDPAGCCTSNVQESLLVQALLKNDPPASPLALFILKGHLELISPPDPERAISKMLKFVKEQKKTAFLTEDQILNPLLIKRENVEEAISFIKSLNPFPAGAFDKKETIFIQTDAVVSIEEGELKENDFENGLVMWKGASSGEDLASDSAIAYGAAFSGPGEMPASGPFHFRIRLLNDTLPKIELSPSFASEKEDFKGLKKSASSFLELLEIRNRAVLKLFSALVYLQEDFFVYGSEKLSPLTQKELADFAGVSESTVSRFADSKYLRSGKGSYSVKYFFSSAVYKSRKSSKDSVDGALQASTAVSGESVSAGEKVSAGEGVRSGKNASAGESVVSGEKRISKEDSISSSVVKLEIKKILEENQNEKKKLSDQKIADILNQRGIKIARRTVAKYRDQLNIESSYQR